MERKLADLVSVGCVHATEPLLRRLSRADCVGLTARHVRRTLPLLDQRRPADRAAALIVDFCEEVGGIGNASGWSLEVAGALQGAIWQVGAPRAGLLGLGVLALLRATAAGSAALRARDAGRALVYSTEAVGYAAWADAVGYPPEKHTSEIDRWGRQPIVLHPAFRAPMEALWRQVFLDLRDLAPHDPASLRGEPSLPPPTRPAEAAGLVPATPNPGGSGSAGRE